MTVVPNQADNDAELTDAVQLVLTRDHLVDTSTIGVRCRRGIVILEGYVPNQQVASIAAADAWCVLGVEEVVNRLLIEG